MESEIQMTDTPSGETATQEEVKNNVTPVAAPTQVNSNDNSEAEALRKELEQAKMRANQLANQLEAKARIEEEANRKKLEEQDEWKQIAEQEKAKREALENERQEAERKQTLRLAEETIFAEFSQEAIDVAKEAGLSLNDDSDEAKNTFKSKLEKISQKVVTGQKVTPNNPGVTPDNENRAELVQQMRMGNKEARDKVISTLDVVERMRQQAGYTKQ